MTGGSETRDGGVIRFGRVNEKIESSEGKKGYSFVHAIDG